MLAKEAVNIEPLSSDIRKLLLFEWTWKHPIWAIVHISKWDVAGGWKI